jgi:hypothetical protein
VLVGDAAPTFATLREVLPPDLAWLNELKAFHLGDYPDDDIRRLAAYFQHTVAHSLQPLTRGGSLGVARNAQVIGVPNKWVFGQQDVVLKFRVERSHGDGPLPVELRGGDVVDGGAIEDDDIVEVPRSSRKRRGQTTRVPFVMNRTTGTRVRVTTTLGRKLQNGVQVALALVVAGVLVGVAIGYLSSGSWFH